MTILRCSRAATGAATGAPQRGQKAKSSTDSCPQLAQTVTGRGYVIRTRQAHVVTPRDGILPGVKRWARYSLAAIAVAAGAGIVLVAWAAEALAEDGDDPQDTTLIVVLGLATIAFGVATCFTAWAALGAAGVLTSVFLLAYQARSRTTWPTSSSPDRRSCSSERSLSSAGEAAEALAQAVAPVRELRRAPLSLRSTEYGGTRSRPRRAPRS